jgi:cyclopropane fatty-acyl-phospholipid synthase-like methyltransferase
VKPGWYEEFFHGLALDLWRAVVSPEQTKAEADFLEQILAVPKGAKLLDVPCGGGRHALALAARGYRMTGVDLSAEFIDEARTAATAGGWSVDWLLSDMRRLPWTAEFDGAYCFGNSFGYLEPEGTEEFIAAVARALRPGARFVIQTGTTAESILPANPKREWYQAGDVLMLIANEYDAVHSCLDTIYTFIKDGRTETSESSHYIHTAAELQRLLARHSLETESLYAGLDRAPFELGSSLLYLAARRAG